MSRRAIGIGAAAFLSAAIIGAVIVVNRSDSCSAIGWIGVQDTSGGRFPWIVRQNLRDCNRWGPYQSFEGIWTTAEWGQPFDPLAPHLPHGRIVIDEAARNFIFDRLLHKRYDWGARVRVRFSGNILSPAHGEDREPIYLVRRVQTAEYVGAEPAIDLKQP